MEKKNILGALISQVKKDQLDTVFANHDYHVPGYICLANVHSIVTSVRHPELQAALNGSWISFADGKPISIYGNLKYRPKSYERITGSDLMNYLLVNSGRLELSHFFFGGSEETLSLIKEKIRDQKLPGFKGFLSPPYRTWSDDEIKGYFCQINEMRPKIIWVGLGAPKQELFMHKYLHLLEYGVMIGAGAAFDYYAGNLKRSPRWMQSLSLEWFYRLIQEPRRLWKRYLITNTRFLVMAIKHLLKKSPSSGPDDLS